MNHLRIHPTMERGPWLHTTIYALFDSIYGATGSNETKLAIGILTELTKQKRIRSTRGGNLIRFIFPVETDPLTSPRN